MKKLQISELPLYPIADNKFYGFILTSSPSWPGGASHFFLDEKVTKKSRQKNASTHRPYSPARFFIGPAHFCFGDYDSLFPY